MSKEAKKVSVTCHSMGQIKRMTLSLSVSPIFSISFMKPFTDGKTLMEKLAVSHDNRLEKIKNRESQLIERLSAWKLDLLKEVELSLLQISNLLYLWLFCTSHILGLLFFFCRLKTSTLSRTSFA